MSKLTDFPTYSAKTKKRVKYGILGSGLIVVLVMAALLTRSPALDLNPGKISVSMEAQVYRDGTLIAERVNDDDLLLESFANLTVGVFSWPNDQSLDVEMYSTSGDGYDFTVWDSSSGGTIWDTTNNDVASAASYGEGTTPPTSSDYGMEADWDSEALDSYSDSTDYFTLTYIYVNDGGAKDWSETGLLITFWSEAEGADYDVLMAHDTFAPVAVVNDDVLVVNYRFNFATGYTTNAITLMRTILRGADQTVTRTCDLTLNTGSVVAVTIYTGSDQANWFCHVTTPLHGGHVLVGTSSSGIPARSAYRILGSTLQTSADVEFVSSPLGVTVAAVFVPTASLTVIAAAYYRYTVYAGGLSGYFMFFALTHSAVYVASGTPVSATFTLEMA